MIIFLDVARRPSKSAGMECYYCLAPFKREKRPRANCSTDANLQSESNVQPRSARVKVDAAASGATQRAQRAHQRALCETIGKFRCVRSHLWSHVVNGQIHIGAHVVNGSQYCCGSVFASLLMERYLLRFPRPLGMFTFVESWPSESRTCHYSPERCPSDARARCYLGPVRKVAWHFADFNVFTIITNCRAFCTC